MNNANHHSAQPNPHAAAIPQRQTADPVEPVSDPLAEGRAGTLAAHPPAHRSERAVPGSRQSRPGSRRGGRTQRLRETENQARRTARALRRPRSPATALRIGDPTTHPGEKRRRDQASGRRSRSRTAAPGTRNDQDLWPLLSGPDHFFSSRPSLASAHISASSWPGQPDVSRARRCPARRDRLPRGDRGPTLADVSRRPRRSVVRRGPGRLGGTPGRWWPCGHGPLRPLIGARRPVELAPHVVHGDLLGNVTVSLGIAHAERFCGTCR